MISLHPKMAGSCLPKARRRWCVRSMRCFERVRHLTVGLCALRNKMLAWFGMVATAARFALIYREVLSQRPFPRPARRAGGARFDTGHIRYAGCPAASGIMRSR